MKRRALAMAAVLTALWAIPAGAAAPSVSIPAALEAHMAAAPVEPATARGAQELYAYKPVQGLFAGPDGVVLAASIVGPSLRDADPPAWRVLWNAFVPKNLDGGGPVWAGLNTGASIFTGGHCPPFQVEVRDGAWYAIPRVRPGTPKPEDLVYRFEADPTETCPAPKDDPLYRLRPSFQTFASLNRGALRSLRFLARTGDALVVTDGLSRPVRRYAAPEGLGTGAIEVATRWDGEGGFQSVFSTDGFRRLWLVTAKDRRVAAEAMPDPEGWRAVYWSPALAGGDVPVVHAWREIGGAFEGTTWRLFERVEWTPGAPVRVRDRYLVRAARHERQRLERGEDGWRVVALPNPEWADGTPAVVPGGDGVVVSRADGALRREGR